MRQPRAPRRRRILHRIVALGVVLLGGGAPGCTSVTGLREREFLLEVAEQRVPCVGMFPQECLQVRERPDAPWTLFYAPIEGFTYEPGFRYLLHVAERPIPRPLVDGPSLTYRLLDVLSKTATP